MVPPQGLNVQEYQICLLNKSIYGLKQASKCWFNHFNKTVRTLGFIPCHSDNCIYVKQYKHFIMYLLFYVDYILIASNSLAYIENIKTKLKEEFSMSYLREANMFLGMNIERDRGKGILYLSQQMCIEKLLDRFNMNNCNECKTPMEHKLQLSINNNNVVEAPYRELIGGLIYLATHTRPDICYGVCILARFQSNPSSEHWTQLKSFKIPQRNYQFEINT